MVEIKTAAELDDMREAGRVVAAAPAAVREHAAVGVSLLELDEAAAAVISGAGAKSAFLDYKAGFAPTPFPAVICASVNEVVVHGVPDGRRGEFKVSPPAGSSGA
ncbi:M24 family metallopeptidase [Streptosporangium sp. NPDC000396]|uniref:M24 family metallopeptidase n=1 Tax=Streptosporangium sp. NPDC000396 TaxID=3366185 RepID=UPI00368EF512